MKNTPRSEGAYTRIVRATCVLVLSIILVAGLWPFHAPRNNVSWVVNENGLRFGRNGSAITLGSLHPNRPATAPSCSLELWLQPGRVSGDSSIFAIDSSADPRAPFLLRQYGTSMAIQHHVVDQQGIVRRPWFKIDGVFHDGEQSFITITSDEQDTAVYVNGVLVARSAELGFTRRDLAGRLVLANSTVDDSWTGRIMGLAIYDRELTSADVMRHFESWISNHQPALAGEPRPLALYLFDERSGMTVHNQVDPTTDLVIPHNYFVLHPTFLNPTWVQYSHMANFWTRWSVWQDIGVNIAGFVPLGFVFLAYLTSVRPIKRPVLVTALLGFFLSLGIEVLQRFLPTRDSGMTDLLTNTTGTVLGVLLYRQPFVQTLIARMVTGANWSPDLSAAGSAESFSEL